MNGVAVQITNVLRFALDIENVLGAANVLNQLFDLSMLSIDIGSLIRRRQKPRLPIRFVSDGVSIGAHGNETGQILILGPQSIHDPRTNARSWLNGIATIHQQQPNCY